MQDVPSYAVAVSSHVLRSASNGLRVSHVKNNILYGCRPQVLARHSKCPKLTDGD